MTNIFGSPTNLKLKNPMSPRALHNVIASRQNIKNILDGKDARILLIIGPCSFHDPDSALEYAYKLKKLSAKFANKLYIIMRVYPEKPRTCVGWKGYVNDPNLDASFSVDEGINNTRKFMLALAEIDMPIATEILNPATYLYYEDLLSWAAIGARTVESQVHREIASNLAIPVAFKNNILGDIDVAINGMHFASCKQTFVGINNYGHISKINALGNSYTHLILRGSQLGPNYNKEHIDYAYKSLAMTNLPANIIVDCSHGNSGKDYTKQVEVFNNVLSQRINGNNSIVGLMLESFLQAGKQQITADKNLLKYGCSITDACLGWEDTELLLENACQQLANLDTCIL